MFHVEQFGVDSRPHKNRWSWVLARAMVRATYCTCLFIQKNTMFS